VADDLVSGAVRYLSAQPDFTSLLGSFPFTDPSNPGVPFIFQRSLYIRVEGIAGLMGTQAVAAVCSYAGGWAAPLDHSSANFQRLSLEIYADPLRDSAGNITSPAETEARAKAVWKVADSHLHRIGSPKTVLWGDLVTTSAQRQTEPVIYPVPDGDGLVRCQNYYGITTFS
jgi:hypothetical protein